MRDDAQLLLLYAEKKSEEAFAELVRRHLGMVYAVALRRVGGHAHLAQEVAQDVFSDLARKAGLLSQRESLGGWLFISTRYAAAKAVRRDRNARPFSDDIEPMSTILSTEEKEPDWNELRPVLDEAIHNLNRRDREAVLLRFFENQTFGEVGATLDLSENAARMRVERALEKLRGALSRRGITSTSAALVVGLSGQAGAAVPTALAAQITALATTSALPSTSLFLYLMALTKTKVGVVMAMALAGGAIMGLEQHREIGNFRSELAASQIAAKESRLRLSGLTSRLTSIEADRTEIATQLEALRNSQKKSAGKKDPPEPEVAVIHLKEVFRDHPEYVALQQKQANRFLMSRFGDGIAALHLSPEKSKALKSLLEDRETSANDAEDLAIQSGAKAHSDEVNKATEAARRAVDREIKTLIGDDGFDTLEALQNYSGFNVASTGVYMADMKEAGIALTPDQSQAFAKLYYHLSSGDKNPASNKPTFREADPSTWLSPLDQQLLQRGATILTPAQLQMVRATMMSENQSQSIIKQYQVGLSNALILR